MDDAAEAEDLDRYYALNLSFHQGLVAERIHYRSDLLCSDCLSLPKSRPKGGWMPPYTGGFLVTQLVINGDATQAEISRAFGVPLVTVKPRIRQRNPT
jgi:hypothetical protein